MPPALPGPLAHLAPLLDHYGYLAVGALVCLDNAAVPVPGQTVLIAAALYAGTGRLSIAAVVVIGIVAAVAGDCLGYWIGRSGGRAFVHRFGRYVLLPPARFEKAEEFFRRNGGKVVTVARFIDGLRQTNGLIAGTTGMPWRRFLFFNTVGAVLWVGAWAAVSYLAGTDIAALYAEIVRYEGYVLAAAVLLAALLVIRHVRRRRARRPD